MTIQTVMMMRIKALPEEMYLTSLQPQPPPRVRLWRIIILKAFAFVHSEAVTLNHIVERLEILDKYFSHSAGGGDLLPELTVRETAANNIQFNNNIPANSALG